MRGAAVVGCAFTIAMLSASLPHEAAAAERYAVIISSPSGGAEYVERLEEWRTTMVSLLVGKLGYPREHVFVLGESENPGTRVASAQEVRSVLGSLRQRAVAGDSVLVFLMGHGSIFEGDDAKFNLVGPDLALDEWAALISPISARVIFVNGTAGSVPYLRKLSGKERIVITATDTVAQRYATIFPEFFIRAFDDIVADGDKNSRVSIWEAFEYASASVKQWFEEQERPATERALLDDTGDGVGREAGQQGIDGAMASATYLEAGAGGSSYSTDPELARLIDRRAQLEKDVAALLSRRESVPVDEFDSALQKLLLEIAEIDKVIRSKS